MNFIFLSLPAGSPAFKYLRRLALACALTFAALCGSGAAWAQGIGASPIDAVQVAARPGARISSDIEVFNPSNVQQFASVEIKDFMIEQNGNLDFREAGTQPHSCAKWIKVNPMQMVLGPKKSVRVRYTIDTPVGLKEEKGAMIIFTTRSLPPKAGARINMLITYTGKDGSFILYNLPPRPCSISIDADALAHGVIEYENTATARVRIFPNRTTDGLLLAVAEKPRAVIFDELEAPANSPTPQAPQTSQTPATPLAQSASDVAASFGALMAERALFYAE